MALTLNNGTTMFLQLRRGVTPLYFPSSKPNHHQIYNFASRNCTRVFSASANASVASKTAGRELQQPGDTSTPGWAEFAENVSGEWDGFGADFTQEGSPIELPESVVPEAYREWEVKVFDWQTQCPTLARPTHFELFYKVIRLLPTVGCEADAATRYSIDERNLEGAAAFAYRPNGCYVAIWPAQEKNRGLGSGRFLELEHCLVDPRDRESRVRIIQVLGFEEKGELELKQLKVFCEQWYGPFRNGDQLGGCAIRDSAFAATKALESSQVNGVWQGVNATASFNLDVPQKKVVVIRELVEEIGILRKTKRGGDGCRLTLLPKQLWCSLDRDEEGETRCQVGWLLDKELVITSRCLFSSDAHLKEIAIACETPELV